MRAAALVASCSLLLGACTGDDPNVTSSGKGKPLLEVSFPDEVEAGSVQEAVIEITNPGPEDIATVAIAFALVGPTQGSSELPIPLVALGSGGENPSVVAVDPEPFAVSDNGTVYTFAPTGGSAARLPEGASLTVTFTIRIPDRTGEAANSLQVYDGNEIDRVRGVRLATVIGR